MIKSKIFKFITLPLLISMILSIAYSNFKENGNIDMAKWKQVIEKLPDSIPFVGDSHQPKTKIVYYIPNAYPQDVYVSKGEWKFVIADTKGYYEIPGYGLTRARGTHIPATGKKCWNVNNLPYKNAEYGGGILVNSLPNLSAVKSNERGCVTISLNLSKRVKRIKANKKIKLVFISLS